MHQSNFPNWLPRCVHLPMLCLSVCLRVISFHQTPVQINGCVLPFQWHQPICLNCLSKNWYRSFIMQNECAACTFGFAAIYDRWAYGQTNWIELLWQSNVGTAHCVGCEILSPPQNLRTMTDSANCAHLSRLINLNDARAKIRCVAVNGEGWVREELMSPCVLCASYRFILMSPFTIKLWLTICIYLFHNIAGRWNVIQSIGQWTCHIERSIILI